MYKEPKTPPYTTEQIDQAIRDLHDLNVKQRQVLDTVKQPDILRSLVISMNSGPGKRR